MCFQFSRRTASFSLVFPGQIGISARLHPFRLARHLGGAERFSVVLTSRDAGPSVALCSVLAGEFSPGFLTGKERPKMSTTNNTTHDPDRSPPMKRF
jgi:hypothetical protein